MILSLLAAILAAPLFWLVVPECHRKNSLAAISLIALGLYDLRLPLLVLALVAMLYAATKAIARTDRISARQISLAGLVCLGVFFAINKLSHRLPFLQSDEPTALASQSGIALLGMSYFVLKAGSILIEASRRNLVAPSFLSLARWLLFFPIFPSGPIEAYKHFDDQEPRPDVDLMMRGLERILLGCVRSLILAHYLAVWTNPILASPADSPPAVLLLAMYAMSFRIYFDFAGYSDIAIGLSALYGYQIQENFDRPLTQRNIIALWQRWHMTLTGWLRIYLFTPYTRALMKRGRGWHRPAIVSGQIVTMACCGIWHDLTPAFLLWGALHGLALAWTGTFARDLGRMLPTPLTSWWRKSRVAYAASTLITLTVFSAINILALVDIESSVRYYHALLRL